MSGWEKWPILDRIVRETSSSLHVESNIFILFCFLWYFWCPLGILMSFLTCSLHEITFSSKHTTSTYLNAYSVAEMQLCSSLSILICMLFLSKHTSGYICTSNYNITTNNSSIKCYSGKCLSKQLAVSLCPEGQADSDFVPSLEGLNSKVQALLHEHPAEGGLRQEVSHSKSCC